MGWTKRWGKRLRTLVRRDAVERELDDELAFHLEMETAKNVRAGMEPGEARREAAISFGAAERFKEDVRDARALSWVSGASLDFKLGLRMLSRYPGLTLVGGFAMAFAIAVGAATFELVTQVVHPRIPLPGGDRMVGIRTWDAAAGRTEERVGADFLEWRRELRSVEELGAFRPVERNLVVPGGPAAPVAVGEMSASGFRVAGVPPAMGRWLVEGDEREGAARVLVIGHDLWRTRFAGDPRVVGREVRLGVTPHTVVGVMPEGFAFPVSERAWTALPPGALDGATREGPEISVFGRLAPGATLGEARAEVATLARRRAADAPATHEHLRADVLPYARSVLDVPWRIITNAAYGTNAGVLAFLLLVCANVAALVFARTATRETELVVRTALGAGRRRIVLQLFVEALVLGGLAAAVGLAAAAFGLRWGLGVFESLGSELPFWFHASLSPRTVLYTAFLAVLAAAVAGVLPALKMTGKGAEARLRQAAVGGSSLRFGRLWTGIIVTQVALTAAFVPLVLDVGMDTDDIRTAPSGYRSEEFLTARLETDAPAEAEPGREAKADPAETARGHAAYRELERRLEAEPGVAGVTFLSRVPGAFHRRFAIEVEGETGPDGAAAGHPRVQTATVAPDFFDVLRVPVLTGRPFAAADAGPGAHAVVVNESFVREILGGRSPVGRRLRYPGSPADEDAPGGAAAEAGPWYEIVGVVRDVIMTVDPDLPHNAGIYHAAGPESAPPSHLAVGVRGKPEDFAPRLRALATAVDPTLRLYEVRPAESARLEALVTYQFWLRMAILACGVVMLLSVLGIYSIMSFTVSRRTREIGIRVALGADRRRIVAAVFTRAFAQVGIGIGLGVLLLILAAGGIHSMRGLALLTGGAAVMIAATAAACVVPTRRVLRIQPIEAMRTE